MDILKTAAEVMRHEAETIERVASNLDENFEKAVKLIQNTSGRVIITGLGKSGHVGAKIAATMASTGTPSFFLHGAEALHGDLGMVTKEDVVISISNSGETKELLEAILSLKIIGAKIISITGNRESSLAKAADIHIEVRAEREADPLNLAPTSSSTAVLAVGDALAVTLSAAKGFKDKNFAVFHPGGSLGKKLLSEIKLERGL